MFRQKKNPFTEVIPGKKRTEETTSQRDFSHEEAKQPKGKKPGRGNGGGKKEPFRELSLRAMARREKSQRGGGGGGGLKGAHKTTFRDFLQGKEEKTPPAKKKT